MTHRFMPLALGLALMFVSGTAVRAQDQDQDQASAASDAVSLSVEVTISRYQGDELIGSLPYMLSVTAGSRPSTLRLNDRVPVPIGLPNVGPDGVSRPRSFNREMVGTRIDCGARTLGDGRYEVNVVIDESSVDGDDQTSTDASVASYPPTIRSFESDNTLVLRDGQSRQYLAAADRRRGETIRVDIALTVLD